MTQTPSAVTKKPWYRTWWAIALGVLVVISFISAGVNAITGNKPDRSEVASTLTEPENAVETAVVPDVVGQDGAAARKALSDAGFSVTFDGGEDAVIAASNWTVDAQDPLAGEELAVGEAVALTVSKPESAVAAAVPELAARAHAEYLNAWGVSDLIELAGAEGITKPIYAITEWEDVSAGTIRIYVQEPITKELALDMGHNVLSLTGQTVTDLNCVVVRGTDGIDVNTYRRDVPLLNQ